MPVTNTRPDAGAMTDTRSLVRAGILVLPVGAAGGILGLVAGAAVAIAVYREPATVVP